MPAVVFGLGMGALILSIAWPSNSEGSAIPAPLAQIDTTDPELSNHDEPAPAIAKRAPASETSARAPESQVERAAPPVVRQAPPSEALPAVQAKVLGASTGRNMTRSSSATSGSAAAAGPYSVAVMPEGPQQVDDVAAELVSRLKRSGFDAGITTLEDAGRPDALIVLGASGTNSNEAWYCDVGPSGSLQLARNLVQAGAAGSGSSEDGPVSNFPCEDVHSGRARVPAVLLELSSQALSRNDEALSAVDGFTQAVDRYFKENKTAVRQARGAAKLVWPAYGPITSYYGPAHPLGIDVGMWQGNIVAATAGTVLWAGGDPCCGYGRYVVIQSSDGIETLYAHLETLAVRKGQKVRQGQALGKVGCTGRCSGPHLHFEVYDNGRRQNPMRYLP
jgi:murein DD-endopeptidase MepM/ murein hydrolase activator NlpD